MDRHSQVCQCFLNRSVSCKSIALAHNCAIACSLGESGDTLITIQGDKRNVRYRDIPKLAGIKAELPL